MLHGGRDIVRKIPVIATNAMTGFLLLYFMNV